MPTEPRAAVTPPQQDTELMEVLLVLRRACLMVARFVERKYGLPRKEGDGD